MIKIAICDDEEVFLNTLERMIRNYEKTIKEKLLIKRYTKPLYLMDSLAEDFQVFFLDMQMPNMDGYEATRTIRKTKHPDAKDIPIVAMTANAFASDVRAAFESGMDAHLAKPIDLDRIKNIVENFT